MDLNQYMGYIKEHFFGKYIVLDVVGDPEASYFNLRRMEKEGFYPVPVFHLGSDFRYQNNWLRKNINISVWAAPLEPGRKGGKHSLTSVLMNFLSCNTEIFTRLRATLARRVLSSGAVGGAVDSTVFVIIGLSPLGAGFIPWTAVPMAILGQFVVKLVVHIGVAIIKLFGVWKGMIG